MWLWLLPRWHVLCETWRITSDYFCFSKTQPSGPSLSISQLVRMSVCVCLPVCLSIFSLFCLNVLLPPLPRIQCNFFFRDLEPLGKSNGKMGFQIWKFLFIKGVKLPPRNFFFPSNFFCTSSLRKHISQWTRDLWSKGVSLILVYL